MQPLYGLTALPATVDGSRARIRWRPVIPGSSGHTATACPPAIGQDAGTACSMPSASSSRPFAASSSHAPISWSRLPLYAALAHESRQHVPLAAEPHPFILLRYTARRGEAVAEAHKRARRHPEYETRFQVDNGPEYEVPCARRTRATPAIRPGPTPGAARRAAPRPCGRPAPEARRGPPGAPV